MGIMTFEELKDYRMKVYLAPSNRKIFALLRPFSSPLSSDEYAKLYQEVVEANTRLIAEVKSNNLKDDEYRLQVDLSKYGY